MRRFLQLGSLLGVSLVGFVGLACQPSSPIADHPPVAHETSTPLPEDIEQQVHDFCGACHAYPPADSFPRRHWQAEVERGYRFFDQSAMPLNPPKLAHVVRYYEDRAPTEYVETPRNPTTRTLPVRLDPVSYPPPAGNRVPMISHVNPVRLPKPGQSAEQAPWTLLASDMVGGRILTMRPNDPNPTWQELAKVPHPAHTEVIDLDRDGILDMVVADLGSFPPTDNRCGGVVWLRGKPDGTYEPITLLTDVGRVADVRAADFRGTGQLDLVVGIFGLQIEGEILLLENHTTDWKKPDFRPRVLDKRHGAIHVPVTDLNGDGKPDFIALIAQEHETIVAFVNDGKGEFREHELYKAPHPGWGSSGIQLVDMNGDGQLDILYTNGDILDEPYLYKPYHGVQWLENRGNLKFELHRVGNMYGIHNAVAANICGGPLPDILAVSFLPADKFTDRGTKKADAVVLFEQVEPNRFERHVLMKENCDAVVCAAADFTGSGLASPIVGNFGSPTSTHPVTIWKNSGKK